MKQSKLEDAIKAISGYMSRDSMSPFFVVVDADSDYEAIREKFKNTSSKYASEYCNGDFFPNYDALCTDIAESEHNIILFGIGEAIKLSGDAGVLGRFFDMYPASKVVVLCRGIRDEIKEYCSHDSKLGLPHRLRVLPPGKGHTIINVGLAE